MNFCSQCGQPVRLQVPPNDNLPRFVCDACDTVHYQNPKVVVGCVAQSGDRVLLCRRAIEPRHGLWTIPAGFMENGETLEQAAIRETREEACAEVELHGLYAVFSIPRVNHVYVMFRAGLAEPAFAPGPESLEVRLFEEAEVPWDALAFRVVQETLRRFYRDRGEGMFPVHLAQIDRR